MMSLNYSAEEFLKIMMTLNFEKFEDGCDLIGPFRLIRHFGWFKGNYFLNLMESYIEKKTGDGQKPGNGRATFRDLVEEYRDRHFKRLYVFGTNLTQQAVQEFSYETTPHVAVADAVRISMSIPFFFEARYYEQNALDFQQFAGCRRSPQSCGDVVYRRCVDLTVERDLTPRLQAEAVQRVDDVKVFAVGHTNRAVRIREVHPASGVV